MTDAEARAEFDRLIAAEADPDKVARLELAREYFTNPKFHQWLSDLVWEINQRQPNSL